MTESWDVFQHIIIVSHTNDKWIKKMLGFGDCGGSIHKMLWGDGGGTWIAKRYRGGGSTVTPTLAF